MIGRKHSYRGVKQVLVALSALSISLGTAASACGQVGVPIDPGFFGIMVNNNPAAPWPATLGVPFSSWRTLGDQLKWSDIEQCDGGSDPTNSCYVWSTFDSAVSQARATGQDILY